MSRPDPKDFFLLNRKDETITRLPGSINGYDFAIDGAENCSIFLLDAIEQITIDYVKDSHLYLGPVNGSIFIRNCTNMTIHAACRQFRTRDCTNCHIYLYCATKSPVIESSNDLHFYPYDIAFPTLNTLFHKYSFQPNDNYWNSIYDFSATDTSIKSPHYIIDGSSTGENGLLKEIVVEMNVKGEKLGEPETPLSGIVKYKGKARETIESLAKNKGNCVESAAAPSGLSVSIPVSTAAPAPTASSSVAPTVPVPGLVSASVSVISPRFNDLADSLLDAADFSSSPTASAAAVPKPVTTSTSSIDQLLAAKAAQLQAKSAAPAPPSSSASGSVPSPILSAELSFTFATSQSDAQRVIDNDEILNSLAQYGEKRVEQQKSTVSGHGDSSAIVSVVTPLKPDKEEKHSVVKPVVIDDLWADLVKSETKNEVDKEMAKKEKERMKMEELRVKMDREEEEKRRKAEATFNLKEQTAEAEQNNAAAESASATGAAVEAEELKRLEAARQRLIEEKLAASAASLQAIASEAQHNHTVNREIRAHLRAEAERIIKQTEQANTKPLSPEESWQRVMTMIPNERMQEPNGKKQLDMLRVLYMSSLAKRGDLKPSGSSSSSADSESLLSSEDDEKLTSVLSSCGCSDFLPQFRSEGVTLDLIPLLDPSELAELVPKLGPRKRLEQWIKQQQQ